MTQDKRFCTKCGASILAGDKFCGSCGQPVSGPAAVGLNGGLEQIAGIIPNAERKSGVFKSETFNIIVSDRRIVFAILTGEMIRAQVKEVSKKGFFSGVAGALTAGGNYYKKYADMAPEEALKENPQNFAVNFNSITGLRIIEGHSHVVTKGKPPVYDESYIEIDTPSGQHKFTLDRDAIKSAREITRKAGFI